MSDPIIRDVIGDCMRRAEAVGNQLAIKRRKLEELSDPLMREIAALEVQQGKHLAQAGALRKLMGEDETAPEPKPRPVVKPAARPAARPR